LLDPPCSCHCSYLVLVLPFSAGLSSLAGVNGTQPGISPLQNLAGSPLGAQQQGMLQQMLLLQQQQQQIQANLASGAQLNPQQAQALQMMMIMARNQQAALLQQQVLAQQAASSAANPFMQYQFATAQAGGVRNVDSAAAKRQAVDGNSQAQALAARHFRQLYANAHLTGGSHMSTAQQTQLYQTLYARARAQLGLPSVNLPSARTNMRVSIDKRNRGAAEKLFHAEDTTGRDHADEVVRRCEEISRALEQHMKKTGRKGDSQYTATDGSSVSQEQLIEACGDTARYLKPYQIVGVNFLMVLYRTNIGGGGNFNAC